MITSDRGFGKQVSQGVEEEIDIRNGEAKFVIRD
jgi:hypothetical protein